MDTLESLEHHRRALIVQTAASIACYAGFLVTSAIASLHSFTLRHPLSLACLGLIVVAFLLLPRNYLPPLLVRDAQSPEEALRLEDLRRLQRTGLYVRGLYLAGALVTLLLVPMLVRQAAR